MISSGHPVLDSFLDGYSHRITSVYGASSTGKTTLALLLTLSFVKNGKKVLFFDVEDSFSVSRFEQLAGCDVKEYLERVFLLKPRTFHEQHRMIKQLPLFLESGKFSLVIVDTLTVYYRQLVHREEEIAKAMLKLQLRILKNCGVPVFVTNQVFSSFSDTSLVPVAGSLLRSYVDKSFQLCLDPRHLVFEKKKLGFSLSREGFVF